MSPRNIERDKQVRQERKRQIMQAALDLFTRKGITACKMSDIAKEAGLSHGHLYNHFSSKEELVRCIVFEAQSSYTGLLETMSGLQEEVPGKLRWMGEAYLRKHYASYWIILQAQASDLLSPEAKGEIQSRMLENLQRLAVTVKQGQLEGTVDDGNPEEIALMITTLLSSASLWGIRGFAQSQEIALGYLLKMIRKG